MERNNKPAPPVSSERDDETRAALVEELRRIGWDSGTDKEHSRLTAALPRLRALLAPPALPAGGNAYPVDSQHAHVMAIAATQGMPEGPEQQLAYTLAMARAMAGATLLDVYAGQLAPMFARAIADGVLSKNEGQNVAESIAHAAYDTAEAMVAERERRHG